MFNRMSKVLLDCINKGYFTYFVPHASPAPVPCTKQVFYSYKGKEKVREGGRKAGSIGKKENNKEKKGKRTIIGKEREGKNKEEGKEKKEN